jgi:hypothetical protein
LSGSSSGNTKNVGFGDFLIRLAPINQLPQGVIDAIKTNLNAFAHLVCSASPEYKLCDNTLASSSPSTHPATSMLEDKSALIPLSLSQIFYDPNSNKSFVSIEEKHGKRKGEKRLVEMSSLGKGDIIDISSEDGPRQCCRLSNGNVAWNGITSITIKVEVDASFPAPGGAGVIAGKCGLEFTVSITPGITSQYEVPRCFPPKYCNPSLYYITPKIDVKGGVDITISIDYTIPVINVKLGAGVKTHFDLSGTVIFDQQVLTCPS